MRSRTSAGVPDGTFYHLYYIPRSGDTQLYALALANGADGDEPSKSRTRIANLCMYNAARSGSRAMCEFVREHSDIPRIIPINEMIRGAIKGESVTICDLAREWIAKYLCVDESREYRVEGFKQYDFARTSLEYAVRYGSRKMCVYMHAWLYELREEFTRELYARFETPHETWRFWLEFSAEFQLAVHHAWYWIADLAYEWAEGENARLCLADLEWWKGQVGMSNTVKIAICGRIARIIDGVE